MATVRRPRRPSLADKLKLDDIDGSLDILDALTEREYDEYVLLYLRGDRRGMEVMRDPDNVERLWDALNRLRAEYRHRYTDAQGDERLHTAAMIRAIETERREIAPEARKEREVRQREQAAEREVEVLSGVSARLERARAKIEEQRRQIEAAQAKTPRARASEELIRRHTPEYLAILREIRRRDAEAGTGEQARENGGGAADPPAGGSTTPVVPMQAAR